MRKCRSKRKLLYVHFIIFIGSIFINLAGIPIFASDLTKEELIEGINIARNSIKSGHARFLVHKIRGAWKTPEEIDKIIKDKITRQTEEWKSHPDFGKPSLDAHFKDVIKGIPIVMKHAYGGWHKIEERNWFFVLYEDNRPKPTYNYRYRIEIRNKKRIDKSSSIGKYIGWDYSIVRVFNGSKQILLDSTWAGNGVCCDAASFPRDRVFSFPHVELFGRSYTQLEPLLVEIINKELSNGSVQYILKCRFLGDSERVEKLWVIPDKGFTISRREIYYNGKLEALIVNNDFKEFENGVWFPKEIIETQYKKGIGPDETPTSDNIEIQEKYILQEAEFNIDIDENLFNLSIPKNVILLDYEYTPPLQILDGEIYP